MYLALRKEEVVTTVRTLQANLGHAGFGTEQECCAGLSLPVTASPVPRLCEDPNFSNVPRGEEYVEGSGTLWSAAFSHGARKTCSDLANPVAPPLPGQQHSLWLSFDSQSCLGGEAADARWTQWHLSRRLSQELMRYCVESASDPCLAHREGSTGHSVPFPCGFMLCLYGGGSLYQKVLEQTWRRLILSLLPAESSLTAGQLSTVILGEQRRHLLLSVHSASAL